MAWEPGVQEVCGALERARREDRVDEVRPGIFWVKTGAERPQLARRDLQSLIRKLRKAILNLPLANRRLALARLLLNLEDEISSVVLGSWRPRWKSHAAARRMKRGLSSMGSWRCRKCGYIQGSTAG